MPLLQPTRSLSAAISTAHNSYTTILTKSLIIMDANGDSQFTQDGTDAYGAGGEFTTDSTSAGVDTNDKPGSLINASRNEDDGK